MLSTKSCAIVGQFAEASRKSISSARLRLTRARPGQAIWDTEDIVNLLVNWCPRRDSSR
jgi:hypothetical protein